MVEVEHLVGMPEMVVKVVDLEFLLLVELVVDLVTVVFKFLMDNLMLQESCQMELMVVK